MKEDNTETSKSYDTIKLGIDAHAKWYYVARQLDGAFAFCVGRLRAPLKGSETGRKGVASEVIEASGISFGGEEVAEVVLDAKKIADGVAKFQAGQAAGGDAALRLLRGLARGEKVLLETRECRLHECGIRAGLFRGRHFPVVGAVVNFEPVPKGVWVGEILAEGLEVQPGLGGAIVAIDAGLLDQGRDVLQEILRDRSRHAAKEKRSCETGGDPHGLSIC